jgi:1-deoxyxylulose-5-phosphate synthase
MTFGDQCDEDTSFAILDRAAESGITFIDTSNTYPVGTPISMSGTTESILGHWLAGKRDQFIVATKVYGRMGESPWQQGLSRKHIFDAVDASLRRLGTDYIDLYQCHHPDANTPRDETLQALDDLVRVGKVRYIGCSNFQGYQVARMLGRSEALGLHPFVSIQPRYSLLFRQTERDLLPLSVEEGLAVLPYNPLAGGLLSGKHDRTAGPTEGTRFAIGQAGKNYQNRYWHDHEFDTVDEIRKVAERVGVSMVTLSLAWVLANPAVTAPIIGASRPDQLDANLAALDYELSPEIKEELDALTVEWRQVEFPS